tara:strand:+ start:345 stop:617 length:273 start_codon:yes stop_codon:yes gene_type:complete
MIDIIDYSCQAAVTCTGFFSLYLLASQDARVRMYAGIVGMIGEPFWLTTAIINEQWGILPLVIIYGVNWVRVIASNYHEDQRVKLKKVSW